MHARVLLYAAVNIGLSLLFFSPISSLLQMAYKDELYSYVPLIPLVSATLIFRNRRAVFHDLEYAAAPSLVIVGIGVVLWGALSNYGGGLSQNDYFSGVMSSAVLCFIGVFLGFFGRESFRAAAFPLCFLFLMVPIPSPVLDRIVLLLQQASAEVAYGFFKLSGMPVLREGFTFHLPGLSIEVAKQCGGIRSSVSLVIVAILASRFVLRTYGMSVLLVLCCVPITLLKNGLRIFTLSFLGVYVDPRVLSSQLHKSGGIPFFALALMLLFVTAWVLRKVERKL